MVSKALRIASQEIYSTADERELFPVSPDGRGIVQVGDAVSVAILKIVNLKELTQKETATAYLRVVHMAFYAPEKILLASDREPKVTLSLSDISKTTKPMTWNWREECGYKELCPKTDVRSTGPMISGTWAALLPLSRSGGVPGCYCGWRGAFSVLQPPLTQNRRHLIAGRHNALSPTRPSSSGSRCA